MRAPCHSKGSGASEASEPEWAQTPGTNSWSTWRQLLGDDAGLWTVRGMANTRPAPQSGDDHGAVLDLEALQRRYDIGKTKATELASSEDFPRSVVPGMHRYPLAAIEAWEFAHSLQGTVAEPKPAPAPAPVVIAPPSPGRPGRKPAARQDAA